MNRRTSLLQRHLLTRSDLAAIEVPATEVFRWLADGQLEQVGELPTDAGSDPVFTVLSHELRRDLDARLAMIDKPTVVMTPLGVRSFLLRALLHQRAPLAEQTADIVTEQLAVEANTREVDDSHARRVTRDEIGDVLQDLVVHRIDDVQTVLQLAAEIAATESVMTRQQPPSAALANDTPFDTAETNQDESMAETPEPDELFDEPTATGAAHQPGDGDELEDNGVFVEIEYDYEPPAAEEGDVAADIGARLAGASTDEAASEPEPEPDVGRSDEGEELLGDLIAEAASDETAGSPAGEVGTRDDDATATEDPVASEDDGLEGRADEPASESSPPEAVEGADEMLDAAPVEPGAHDAGADDATAAGEPVASEPTEGAAVSEEPDPATENAEFALTSATMDRVQDFLGELKSALVEMAQRPSPPQPAPANLDVEPLIQAVQAGFDRSAEQATQTTSALASLAQRMGEFGERVEAGVHNTVRSIQTPQVHAAGPVMAMTAPQAEFVDNGGRRQTLVLSSVALLVVCWSILFWIKTGSPRLALGTLVGANAVACCLLLARRNR